MSSKPLPAAIQKEYRESLAKIETLCANKEVMGTTPAAPHRCGEVDDEASYMKNISETLDAWKGYADDVWRI